jgi:hypothetical protein
VGELGLGCDRGPTVTPMSARRQQIRPTWLPNVEPFVLPGATHVLHVKDDAPCSRSGLVRAVRFYGRTTPARVRPTGTDDS